MSSTAAEIYQHDHFLAQRQVFKLLGAAFRLKTADGRLLAYSKQKAFKLREDIRVYSDEAQTVELLHIRADRIIDFSVAYSVVDSHTGEHVGSLRRHRGTVLHREHGRVAEQGLHVVTSCSSRECVPPAPPVVG